MEKRTIKIDGEDVVLASWANWVVCDLNGAWFQYRDKPNIVEHSSIVWGHSESGFARLTLPTLEFNEFWKDSLIDLNDLPKSNPKAWSISKPILNEKAKIILDNCVVSDQNRMIDNDLNPVNLIAKVKPATIYRHECTSCGAPCNMTNMATVCGTCAP